MPREAPGVEMGRERRDMRRRAPGPLDEPPRLLEIDAVLARARARLLAAAVVGCKVELKRPLVVEGLWLAADP
eukprot:1894173-Prymnesium_polylepis.1